MADQPEKPAKRWVLIKMLHRAVERTEAQIEELKAGGLWIRDASGPEDHHDDPRPGGQDPVLIPESAPRPATQPAVKAADKPAA